MASQGSHNPQEAGSIPAPATTSAHSSVGRAPDLGSGGPRFESLSADQVLPLPDSQIQWVFRLLSLNGIEQNWIYGGSLLECFALRDYFFDKQSVFTARISYDGTPIFDCNRRKSHTMMLDPQTLFLPVKK